MKWTKENDDKLIKLINFRKNYKEISCELQISIKSIYCRCHKLGLKVIYNTEIKCKKCKKLFIANIKTERKFCSNNCSNSYNNTNRVQNEECKKKISNALKGIKHSKSRIEKISGEKNKNWIDGRSIKRLNNKINGKRKCKYCELYRIDKKHKSICDICRNNYYNFYRPSCEFNFDVKQYKDRFDFNLVKQYGWYSPTNKGHNLCGVSRDHLYSVRDGFINKIDCEIIKHPANCKLMIHSENNLKNYNSSITLDELLERIKNWK